MTTYRQSSEYDYDDSQDDNRHREQSHQTNDDRPSLSLGDRIVWLSDGGPEYGFVRWLGKLHELGQEWMAGVEFDNPVGSGTGLYKDRQLFVTELNHASLVPIIGLLKASDFDGPPRPPGRSSSVRLIDINHEPSDQDHQQYQLHPHHHHHHHHNDQFNRSRPNSYRSSSGYRPFEQIDHGRTASYMPPPPPPSSDSNPYFTSNVSASNASFCKPKQSISSSSSRVRHIPIQYEQEIDRNHELIPHNHHHKQQQHRITIQQPNTSTNIQSTSNAISIPRRNQTDKSSSLIDDLTTHMNRTNLSQEPQHHKRDQLIDISPATDTLPDRTSIPLLPDPPLDVATNVKNASSVLKNYLGKSRGIQGHNNSCYLDATLFAMFSSTTLFDSLLYRAKNSNDIPEYEDIQRVLREDIVRPLRSDFIVNADQVMMFRTLLEQSSSVEGLTDEEKDPEEFLSLLLGQILKADPYLKLSSGCESFFYQLIVDKDESIILPTVQDLFEQSFMKDSSNVRLSEIPPCIMLQMPRFGAQFKMYSRIMPTLKLDITDVLEAAPRPCGYRGKDCDNIAVYECRDCFGDRTGRLSTKLASITYCANCFQAKHFGKSHSTGIEDHDKTKTALNKNPVDAISRYSSHKSSCKDKEIPRVYMDLFAVLCIETSHYVCFVKCGQNPEAPWCFFDSMADRQGEQNGYNIPEVSLFDEFGFWTSDKGLPFLLNHKDDKLLPEMARRLICDAYLCFYQYPPLLAYR